MFIYREGDPSGTYLIPQTSHAWLAWQVAEHWGNRNFARPAPRAETLAAVLLHDSGWTESDGAPLLDEGGGRGHLTACRCRSIWRSGGRASPGPSSTAAIRASSSRLILPAWRTASSRTSSSEMTTTARALLRALVPRWSVSRNRGWRKCRSIGGMSRISTVPRERSIPGFSTPVTGFQSFCVRRCRRLSKYGRRILRAIPK